MRRNKKGSVKTTLIGIFVLLLVISISYYSLKAKIKMADHPIGSSETALIEATDEIQKAYLYFDYAIELAVKKTEEEIRQKGLITIDNEEQEYPCGKLTKAAYWYKKKNCLPKEPTEVFKETFDKELKKMLLIYPVFSLPQEFYYYFDKELKDLTIESAQPLTIRFQSKNRKLEITNYEKSFEPDYVGAETKTGFIYGNRNGQKIENIILHYTVTRNAEQAFKALKERGLSYHYIIDKDGTIYQLVPENKMALHAGCKGKEEGTCEIGYNSKSIGIALVNCGYQDESNNCKAEQNKIINIPYKGHDKWEQYTQEQISSLAKLIADIEKRNNLLTEQGTINENIIINHSDVDKGKTDPGPALNKKAVISLANQELKTGPILITGKITANDKQALKPEVIRKINSYEDIIKKYSEKYGVEEALIKAIIYHESLGNEKAKSEAGALGLMQIVPFYSNGKNLNHGFCVEKCGFTKAENLNEFQKKDLEKEYFEPEKNICCGTAIIKRELENKKPISWDCTGGLIDKGKRTIGYYDTPITIALRRYNGANCANWVDPDYVETVMKIYKQLGGKEDYYYKQEGILMSAELEAPLKNKVKINMDLKEQQEIIKLAEKITNECIDSDKSCAEKIIRESPLKEKLTTETNKCSENPFIDELMMKYYSCEELETNNKCAIIISNETIKKQLEKDKKITLLIQPRKIRAIKQVASLIAEFPTKKKIYYEDKEGKEQETTSGKIIIEPNDDETKPFKITYSFPEASTQKETNEFKLIMKPGKEKETLIILNEEGKEKLLRPNNSLIICEEKQNLTFALELDDKVPPPIKELEAQYIKKENEKARYRVRITPNLFYEDGKKVKDLKEIIFYCKIGNNIAIEEETPKAIIKPEKELFTGMEGPITFEIDSCGGKEIPVNNVIMAAIQKDKNGQYNQEVVKKIFSKDDNKEIPFTPLNNNLKITFLGP